MNSKNSVNNNPINNINEQQNVQVLNNNQNFNYDNNSQNQDYDTLNNNFQHNSNYLQSQTTNQNLSSSLQMNNSQNQNFISNSQSFSVTPNQNQQKIVSSNSIDNSQKQISKKRLDSSRDNSKWIFPRNFKRITVKEFNNLPSEEKKQYENIKNSARKIGYVIEKRSLMKFYRISLLDFIPFYIGPFISFIKFIIGYGDIVRSINFDKKTVWGFRSNFIIGMVFSLVIWPIFLICVTIIYPYMVLDSSTVTYAWNHLADQLNINGIQAFGTGIQAYIQEAIVPLFHGDLLAATIIVFLILSMLNVDTFLFKGLLNVNRKVIFKIQRESVKDEIEKIRVQRPVVNQTV